MLSLEAKFKIDQQWDPANPRSGKILIVEDEALIRETIALALSEEGYETIMVEDGQAAYQTLRHAGVDCPLSSFVTSPAPHSASKSEPQSKISRRRALSAGMSSFDARGRN